MIDDKELIRKFTSGDEKAFDQIVQNNLNNVFGFFLKITRDEMAAEDLTQDVFLKLYKNLKNFRYESNFSTYLYRINSNTANSWITRNKWKSMLHLEQIAEEGKYDQNNEFECILESSMMTGGEVDGGMMTEQKNGINLPTIKKIHSVIM